LQRHFVFKGIYIAENHSQPLLLQVMKLTFFIVTCIMLYMSCIPCGDMQDCTGKEKTSITAANGQQHERHQSEACTPFCVCSCCSASVLHFPIAKMQLANTRTNSLKFPLFNVAFDTEVHSSIWQPPQLQA